MAPMSGVGGRRAHPADDRLYRVVAGGQAGGHALFEVMVAVGLLSTAILGALAAEWTMARASGSAALHEQAFLLADARVEAERGGAQHSLDWTLRARALPHGEIEMTLAEQGMQSVMVTWNERAMPRRHRAMLAYRSVAPS